ncbi:MAG: transglycosylase SLT domain-containing protein [Deltaproteobacteria bacterium]|nr:transglycosylase SLT domain-containing protein [Deltaproteobacteria bacterium]
MAGFVLWNPTLAFGTSETGVLSPSNLAMEGVNLPSQEETKSLQELQELTADVPPSAEEEEVITYDVPVVMNDRVEFFIKHFQTKVGSHFERWLTRSQRYLPMMKEIMKENGLPEDLAYLALIESGFNPLAVSRAKAVGIWQFMKGTAKKYDLRVDWWVDERRNPEKSTRAAARYLKDLYGMFNSWYLAAASYNAGEGKIQRAINRHKSDDFWVMARYRYLKRETKDYIPKYIAALMIAKEPEKYGFYGLGYYEPLAYDEVEIPGVVDLRVIARACDCSVEEVKELNPELLRWFTPPDYPGYRLKIPAGKAETLMEALTQIPLQERLRFLTHKVKNGETLSGIAMRYGVTTEPILYFNNHIKKTSLLRVGVEIVIPLRASSEPLKRESPVKVAKLKTLRPSVKEVVYTVKKGDTLWDIAERFGVKAESVMDWNNLADGGKLFPGDRLKIYPAPVGGVYPEEAMKREGVLR